MRACRYKNIMKMLLGILCALGLAAAAGILTNETIYSLAEDGLNKASQCSFVIPPYFIPGQDPGTFINKSYPMESSSIKYSQYDNGKEKNLTNREKLEQQNALFITEDKSQMLTKEIYQRTMSDAYNQDYGEDVGFDVSSFTPKDFDGYPGYYIQSKFNVENDLTIYQDSYIILSKYKTFTITYQRASDDDCEEMFEKSAATIHVR